MANKIGRQIDNAIGLLFPKWGFERAANRSKMLLMQSQVRKYEGAGDGRRASSWLSNNNPSVNQVIIKDLKKLVSRSRELSINTGYGKKAPFEIANNVIGSGLIATPYIADVIEGGKIRPMKDKKKYAQALQVAFAAWANETKCDYNNDFTFYGLQHLCIRTIVTSGEVLAVRKRVKQEVNKYGFQILILEGDYIDSTKNTLSDKDGGYTFYGVKYDKDYKRSGYWIYDRHPSEANAKSSFFDIKDVIHSYDVERPGQNRGVPFAAPTITTQRDLSDYMDAELLAKKGAACFSAIVQKDASPEEDNESTSDLEHLEPGTVQYLSPGETMVFPTLPQNPGLKDFVAVQHRSIAAGFLIPYETLTGDFSQVNFSSGRLGQLSFQKQIAYWQYLMFIPKFCDNAFQWFVEGYKIAQSLDAKIEIKANWTAPRREMVDPSKEIKAMREEVRAGFASWQEKVRENGYDPQQVLKELIEDQKNFKDADLMQDWTPFFELTAKVKMNKGSTEPPNKKSEE